MSDPRLAMADVIATAAELKEAEERARSLLAKLEQKTRRPHACHVCGTITKEQER